MYLYFIRHAQSANNHAYIIGGDRQADPPLTRIGHEQAQRLASFLAIRPIDDRNPFAIRHDRGGCALTHLYSSLMLRAIETGDYIARATGLPLRAWPEIHERGGLHETDPETGVEAGVAGPGRSWFAAHYPALLLPDPLAESGWWNRNRESQEEYMPRARAVWRQLIERHGNTDDRVAIVSHGGFFQSMVAALILDDEIPAPAHVGAQALWFGISNTSISRFDFHEGIVALRYFNRVDHLPDDLITG